VTEYLNRKVTLGRMWTIPVSRWPKILHISPLGLIPKKNKPGKWRLLADLSSPEKKSVNKGIDPVLASLAYSSVDHLVALVASLGREAFLVKADVKEAYRMVPVHPEDQYLLGVQWESSVYVDKVLPFGLSSAPKIFSALADALQWILHNNGVTKGLHYLDNYILVAKDHQSALSQKVTIISTFERLGVPLEISKLEGPTRCLTFLGIEIDTASMQLRLPRDKLDG